MRIRLVSYNLLDGGRDGDDERRLQKQVEIVRDQTPHILLLQEARQFDADGAAALYRLEAEFGMRGFLAPAPRTGQHLAIFIREPLRPLGFISEDAHYHHALARLELAAPGLDGPLKLVCTHLCPYAPAVRHIEASYLIGSVPAKGYTLIGGDFNSTSAHDPQPDNFHTLPADHRVRHLAADLSSVDRSVMSVFEAAGWTDIGHRHGDLTPTAPTAGFPTRPLPHHRSDYLLASPQLARRIVHYGVLRNPLTDAASDHYPLFAEIDLDA